MPEVARVFRHAFSAVYPQVPALHSPEDDVRFFSETVFAMNSIFVAEAESGEIFGFIAFNGEFIDYLYLAPDAQRKGIGSELLAVAQADRRKLQLWTFQQNTGAREFYRRHGFVEVKETDGAATEEKQPDVLLEWKTQSSLNKNPTPAE
ncbi:MAG: N-acetyltransferase family protein [Bdellovibrionota bacterium]